MKKFERTALLILDGWGNGLKDKSDAIFSANTPFMDGLIKNYPNAQLVTYGEKVGLPEGQMGNSEVGHLNIGAGRIVFQELARINHEIKNGSFQSNKALIQTFEYAAKENKTLHLMGLLSDGGVHAHIQHLKALCDAAVHYGLTKVQIHIFTDGRDTDPHSGAGFVKDIMNHISGTDIEIASLIGRYYAMDRDHRWERIKLAYDLLTQAKGKKTMSLIESIQESYQSGISDEFIQPISISGEKINDGDALICFNFRTDRCRELSQVLTQTDFPAHDMHKIQLNYTTMTRYDEDFRNIQVMYEKDNLVHTLGEVLSLNQKSQIRIAETEKYPHVTFFFSGGREQAFEKEKRIIIPSPKVATYDLKPSMSAKELTDQIKKEIQLSCPDFICLNYANTDMVGHTGVFDAAVEAAETVDQCLTSLIPSLLEKGYGILIIADHGNSDFMVNTDGSPNTAHTTNPVPIIFVGQDLGKVEIKSGKLADIAPTILELMGLKIPDEMTGDVLIQF